MTNARMSDATRRQVLGEIESGRDDACPAFMFQNTATTLLLAVTGSLVDPLELTHHELASRGLNADGVWVGFDQARKIHGVAPITTGNDPVVDSVAEASARRRLRIETLRSRYSDALDLHEVSIWSVRDALAAAYKEGAQAVRKPEAK